MLKEQLTGISIEAKVKSYTTRKPYLNYLIDPSFQRVNRCFVLLSENSTDSIIKCRILSPKGRSKRLLVEAF